MFFVVLIWINISVYVKKIYVILISCRSRFMPNGFRYKCWNLKITSISISMPPEFQTVPNFCNSQMHQYRDGMNKIEYVNCLFLGFICKETLCMLCYIFKKYWILCYFKYWFVHVANDFRKEYEIDFDNNERFFYISLPFHDEQNNVWNWWYCMLSIVIVKKYFDVSSWKELKIL